MKIIHFADLHLGVENYGSIDPATGFSSRLNDFVAAFDRLVEYALEERVDLVLFCGDAYKNREPGQTLQREFARRIVRLATNNIPVFLLTGNHDLPNAAGRATATEIFETLSVKNVYVANKPEIHVIPTAGGKIQVAALPWLRRSALIAREDIKNLPLDEVKTLMEQKLTDVIATLAGKVDPRLPGILAAHLWVGNARVGSESLMSLGQEHSLLLSSVALPAFDYVALGHIHKNQVLNEHPPVVYAGSLERVDFSEENDEKGFYVVEILPPAGEGHRHVSFKLQPVDARRFLTINADVEANDANPMSTVFSAITARGAEIKGAIVRLNIEISAGSEGLLRDGEIRNALREAHHVTVTHDIRRETRTRLGMRTAEEITPLAGLKAWIETQDISPERQKVLLEYGEKLIDGQET
ncbi:MAG: nuclease SbcCD subunit D [Chloroflexi bacterium RBG_16_56_11]|nr:MAG: nuclease SbcCD subunit D [Chloroflexi bacterium RBG_16_56_11]